MTEIWKDIKGYEGLYQVSSLGNIKSLKFNKEKILIKRIQPNGYENVILYSKGEGITKRVHRLVAEAFIPNPDNLPEVNHKNENKMDNRVENLEWCNRSYNYNYGTPKQKKNNKKSIIIQQYSLNNELIKEYPSIMEIERLMNYANSNIISCCRGKYKQAYGYIWKYKKAV